MKKAKKGAKRGMAVLLALCMFQAFSPAAGTNTAANAASAVKAEAAAKADTAAGGETLNYRSKTFCLAETEGTYTGTIVKDGVLALAEGSTSGDFTSADIDIGTFKILLASWNARTNGGKMSVAVRFEAASGQWSRWYSWGVWSSAEGVSGSGSDADGYAAMDIDTLRVKGSCKPTGKINIRVSLEEYGGGRPVVSAVTIATPQMSRQREVPEYPERCLNEVPMRSQLAPENGADGGRICSPTTAVMAIEYMGSYVPTMTAARGVYDNGAGIYGNWSFAVAYAGELGYTAYVDLYDANMIKYALSRGCAVGCSTALTSSGHLVLIVGYDEARGEYIVNDPNVSPDAVKRTNYKYGYFDERWLKSRWNNLGVVYVFQRDKTLQVPVRKGDVNGDGEADNLDAALILQHDAGVSELGEAQMRAADVNGDGKADNLDASLILQYDAGLAEEM